MTKEVHYTHEDIARAKGIDIAYDIFGDAEGVPLLLIMGFTAQMIMWHEDFCEGLARRGYRVIRFDNRDVGHSTWLTGADVPNIKEVVASMMRGEEVVVPYRITDMANDTAGLMDALNIETAHVVGMSMGGMIAQTMAIQYPRRIRSITSLASSTGHPGLPPPKAEAFEYLTRRPPAERKEFIEMALPLWRFINGPRAVVDEELIRDRARRTFDRGVSLEGYARQMAAIIASGNRREALKTIDLPTLVIHGDDDPLLPVAHGIDTAEAIPGATLHIVEGMGHDIPPVFWPELIEVIAGHAR